MRKNSISIRMIGITACLFLIFAAGIPVSTALAADNSNPPFVPGQVVVAGGPDGLPDGYNVIKYLPNANLTVVAVEPGRERGHIQSLMAKGFRANLNLIAKASYKPNDPLYLFQWHLKMVQSEEAWGLNAGSDVIVAVLDTGLATGGEDRIGCTVLGHDVVNGGDNPDDGNGHGTHVSGTIAQTTNNGIGVAGLAYDACIMPVKVLDDSGSGTFADIADGINYAVDNGAKVINMSLGTNARYNIRNDSIMDPALNYAYANGVTVVCASGNDGSRKNVSYPAIYPTTIAVGAVDFSENVTRYSNKGYGLDLVAPGGDTSKDLNQDGKVDGVLQETFGYAGWTYYFFQGTSMASPHVAAIAAMLISYETATTPDEVYDALTLTTADLGDAGYDSVSGYGLVQAFSALNYIPGTCTDADGDGVCVEDGDCDDSDPLVFENCSTCVDKGGFCSSDGQCCSGRCAGIKCK